MVYDLQKASLWKRTAAWLFDGILLSVLVVGVAFVLSAVLNYDRYSEGVSQAYGRYEARYGISFNVSEEEYRNWPEQTKQVYEQAYEELLADEQAMYNYNMVVSLTMLIASLSVLVAVAVLELLIPLRLKNGQTIGKKIFGLCVVRTDCVQVNSMQMFARTVLGKFAIEIMLPVYILLMIFLGLIGLVGTVLLLALLIGQAVCLIATRRNAALHDLLAGTAVADFSSQMIFSDAQELIEFKKRIHAEQAAAQEY